MVVFLCTRGNSHPIRQHLRAIWPRSSGARVQPVHYEEAERFTLRPGLYIFGDLELLDANQRRRAATLHERLQREPERYRCWNNPLNSGLRWNILDTLGKSGANGFRAFRAEEPLPADVRFPVFIRSEHEHTGALTPLLRDAGEVRAALARIRSEAGGGGALLVVEFLDYASPDGVYRKFSSFRLGGRVVGKHLLFANEWMLRDVTPGRFEEPEWLDEERRFVYGETAHAGVEAIFDQFGIDYGRIDYAWVDGRPRVFEINTNPMVLKSSQFTTRDVRLDMHLWFADRFDEALREADPVKGLSPARSVWWRLHRPKINPIPWWRRMAPGWDRSARSAGDRRRAVV